MNTPVIYTKEFLSTPDAVFKDLWNELDWERRPDAPRREYWTNSLEKSYSYGRGAGLITARNICIFNLK